MTLDEMRKSTKVNLFPGDVAEILGCNPYTMNVTVKKKGHSAYPFTTFWSGNRLAIPRLAFIAWAEANKMGGADT